MWRVSHRVERSKPMMLVLNKFTWLTDSNTERIQPFSLVFFSHNINIELRDTISNINLDTNFSNRLKQNQRLRFNGLNINVITFIFLLLLINIVVVLLFLLINPNSLSYLFFPLSPSLNFFQLLLHSNWRAFPIQKTN